MAYVLPENNGACWHPSYHKIVLLTENCLSTAILSQKWTFEGRMKESHVSAAQQHKFRTNFIFHFDSVFCRIWKHFMQRKYHIIHEDKKKKICNNIFCPYNAEMINYLMPTCCDGQFSVRIKWKGEFSVIIRLWTWLIFVIYNAATVNIFGVL